MTSFAEGGWEWCWLVGVVVVLVVVVVGVVVCYGLSESLEVFEGVEVDVD